jgi:hypothetical protein
MDAMTLTEFVQRLQALEQAGCGEYTVRLDDWSQGYARPSAEAAEKIDTSSYHREVVVG